MEEFASATCGWNLAGAHVSGPCNRHNTCGYSFNGHLLLGFRYSISSMTFLI